MFRKHASGGQDIIRVGPTRFASNFISLESLHIYENERKYFMYHKSMRDYIDKSNVDAQMDYLDVWHIVEDNKFWDRVSHYMKVVTPLVKIRMVDGDDKNDMGYLYEAMDRAKLGCRNLFPESSGGKLLTTDGTIHYSMNCIQLVISSTLDLYTMSMQTLMVKCFKAP